MNRTERLLYLIDYLLKSSEPVSWSEIKNRFPEDYAQGAEEMMQRRFERDKAELVSLGIPIEYRRGDDVSKEGYIILEEKLFLRQIEFIPAASSLLTLTADDVRDRLNGPCPTRFRSALYKVISVSQGIPPPTPPDWPVLVHRIRDALKYNRANNGDGYLDGRMFFQLTGGDLSWSFLVSSTRAHAIDALRITRNREQILVEYTNYQFQFTATLTLNHEGERRCKIDGKRRFLRWQRVRRSQKDLYVQDEGDAMSKRPEEGNATPGDLARALMTGRWKKAPYR